MTCQHCNGLGRIVEVRRLRAKLVAAALWIARRHQLDTGHVAEYYIKRAHDVTGIRLKFEGGRFVEEKS